MIKTEELRIGNWVLHDGKPVQVEKLENDGQINNNFAFFDPIPLTEEILLKCGFEHGFSGFKYEDFRASDMADNGVIQIEFGNVSIGIKYLHKLQNLYFALTGKELNIDL